MSLPDILPAVNDGQTIKQAGLRDGEPADDLDKCVGDTGIEPVTSSV
jgi:hypothetical protein